MRNITKFAALALALLVIPAAAQERKLYMSWVPKKMVAYSAPNKPITRIADILAKHKGQKSWKEDVVKTDRYHAQWIQMAPGEKTRTIFYADDRTVWIVWGGQVKFTIKGQEPFIASEGDVVYVPSNTWHATRFIGDNACRLSITEYVANALLLPPQ